MSYANGDDETRLQQWQRMMEETVQVMERGADNKRDDELDQGGTQAMADLRVSDEGGVDRLQSIASSNVE